MKSVLITRPAEEAAPLAELLFARGIPSVTEPLLSIRTMPQNQAQLARALARKPKAILITSRNAVRALSELSPVRDIPLFCVGAATAAFAESAGFAVSAHAETAEALTKAATAAGGNLLYLRGKDIRFDLAGHLGRENIRVDSVTLYEAIPVTELSATLRRHILKGTIASALFFSVRTAETYVRLVQKHGVVGPHRVLSAISLSAPIGIVLRPLPWRGIRIAAKPDMAHLVQAAEDAFR